MKALQQAGRHLYAAQQVAPALLRSYATLELPTDRRAVVSGLAGRYALALFNVGNKEGQAAAYAKDLNEVVKGIQGSPAVKQLFEDPTVSRTSKSKFIEEALAEAKISPAVKNMLGVLVENKRERLLLDIQQQMSKLMAFEKGEVQAIVTTSQPMDDKTSKSIRSTIEAVLPKGKTLAMEAKVDPRILGGHVIEIGDYFLDRSYKKQIDELAHLIRTVDLQN